MKPPASTKRQSAERLGRFAEARAAMMLRLKGYQIVSQRWKSPVGEIDLVARKANVISFIEVKARQSVDEALNSVSPHQRRRIIMAARHWLASNPDTSDCDCRFDIVLVTPYQWPQHLENAFSQDDQ